MNTLAEVCTKWSLDSQRCTISLLKLREEFILPEMPVMIRTIYTEIVSKYPRENPVIRDIPGTELPSFSMSYFCSDAISKWIQKNTFTGHRYTNTSTSRPGSVVLSCMIPIGDHASHRVDVLHKAKRVAVIADILELESVHINMWLSPYCKFFPKQPNDQLTFDHLNSGATNTRTIDIWRSEESSKVLVHELIHCANSHFMEIDKHQFTNRFKVTDCSMVRPYEAFVEWQAIIFHICFICKELGVDPQYLQYLFHNEYMFGVIQTAKMLKHFKFESWEECISSKVPSLHAIDQETDAISYIIIKTALLNDSSYWFSYCDTQKIAWTMCCNSTKFYEWIDDAINNKNHAKNINVALGQVHSVNEIDSLRMSAIEVAHV